MDSKYICPILTSVNKDGSVNYEDMHKLYDSLIAAGIQGVLVGGSAGEFYAFTYEELQTMILDAVHYIGKRMIVLAGTGRMSEGETVSLSNDALEAGADAVIVVGPYYSACTQENIYHYYDDILGKIKGNVFLYNYADRTGYDVSGVTILRLLARHKNFVGVKDTHPVLRHTQKLVQEIKEHYPLFKVFTGYDNNCIPVVISGGDGCIGALSNVYPDVCHKIIEALGKEDLKELKELQRTIDRYMQLYEIYTPFNAVMKWTMQLMGKPMQENCKAPLQTLTKEEKSTLREVVEALI